MADFVEKETSRLESDIEMCAKFAAALFRVGFAEQARSWMACVERLWLQWIEVKERRAA